MGDLPDGKNVAARFNRRELLAAIAAALPAVSLQRAQARSTKSSEELSSGVVSAQNTYFLPSVLRENERRGVAWTDSITVRDGELIRAVAVYKAKSKDAIFEKGPMGFSIAKSTDGVHWQELEGFTCQLEHGVPGFCMRWTGHEFVIYVTEDNPASPKDHPLVVKQYRSLDLRSWVFMGEDYTTTDDRRWYRCRWDELVILPDGDRFYGYITSEPHARVAVDSLGMLESADGLRWTVIKPPVIEWGDLPSQQMEVGFCEKIDGRYYLGMGARCYLGSLGYSMVTFIADSPAGPFRPDREAFRLCGTTSRDVTWLGKSFLWNDERLFNIWVTKEPGQQSWSSCPLKKLRTDGQGHLRLHWWTGNEKFKTSSLPANWQDADFVHPATPYRGKKFSLSSAGLNDLTLQAGPDGAVALMPTRFDLQKGLIIEGTLRANESSELDDPWRSHWHAAAAGFFLEESAGKGLLMQFETLGLTRTGLFEYRAAPAFSANDMGNAAEFIRDRHGGPYLGLSRFEQEDVVGPFGYATPCGIRNGKTHRFRLMVSSGIIELYLDDFFVQTYLTGKTSGKVGLFGKSGKATFSDLSAWSM